LKIYKGFKLYVRKSHLSSLLNYTLVSIIVSILSSFNRLKLYLFN